MLDATDVKKLFPALHREGLVYLDNAATTQIPSQVLQAITGYEYGGRGNPYRGLHVLAERATNHLAEARATIATFLGAQPEELLLTKGTTEGLNLLAYGLGAQLETGDEVVLTIFEHHAQLLPWRELAKERGFVLKYLPMAMDGTVDLALAKDVIGSQTKVVAMVHASNVLGSLLPVRELAQLAHKVGAQVIVDAAQSVGHLPLDVHDLGCDALAFGGHKMYGPEGVGAVYVAEHLRPLLKPLLYGGGMVDEVLDDAIRYADDVRLFEAGSPNVSGAVGLAAACQFLQSLGLDKIYAHELGLANELLGKLADMPRVKVHTPGQTVQRIGIVSFSLSGIHSHDVAQMLADDGIAVRAGYHCAAPLTRCLDLSGTVRVSFGIYNSSSDVALLVASLQRILDRFPV